MHSVEAAARNKYETDKTLFPRRGNGWSVYWNRQLFRYSHWSTFSLILLQR